MLDTKVRKEVGSANAAMGSPDNVLPKGFTLQAIAHGSDPLENASGVITRFGLWSGHFTRH